MSVLFVNYYNIDYFYFYFLCITFLVINLIGILISKKNILIIFFCLESILVSLSMLFVTTSFYHDDIIGQLFFLLILGLGAADISIALALLVRLHKINGNIFLSHINKLKG